MDTQCKKTYVSVNVDIDEEGTLYPRFIRWNNGIIYKIDRILYKCRASSTKVSGGGIRYTVLVKGKETFLFHDGSNGSWKQKSVES